MLIQVLCTDDIEGLRCLLNHAFTTSHHLVVDLGSLSRLPPAVFEVFSSAAMKARILGGTLIVQCSDALYQRLARLGWTHDVVELQSRA